MSAPIDTVVVSYNRQDLLAGCLDALRASTRTTHVIVVDNASTDGSVALVERGFPDVSLLVNPDNLGFAKAVNRGAAAGSGAFVLLLNSDARLRTDTLTRLAGALEADPRLGAVGPRILDGNGEIELSSGRTMSLWNEAWFKIAARLLAGPSFLAGQVRARYERDHATPSLTAACLLVRREAFDTLGGLDESFFMYAEDVDFCRRLRHAGWELRYLADAHVEHIGGASGTADRAAVARHYRASQMNFYAKHRSVLSGVILRAYLEVRFGLGALAGDRESRDIWAWLRDGAARGDSEQ